MSASDKDDPPKPSGRVRHDSGGRAIWEWAVDSGRHAIDSTSGLLKKLELTGLHLLDDKKKTELEVDEDDEGEVSDPGKQVPTFGGQREVDPQANRRTGFNPYNTRLGAKKEAGKPKPPPKARITQPVRPSKRPGLLARLFGQGKK